MRSNYKVFDFEQSIERIDSMLSENLDVCKSSDVPKIEELGDYEGEYVECSSIFIDLRNSTEYVDKMNNRFESLGRIYKTYISEIVSIINSFKTCKEINIVGDCVSAVFSNGDDGKSITHDVLYSAGMINKMMRILNKKYQKKWNYLSEIKAGIGIAKGEALVMTAGLADTDIKQLIYMGNVVNKASKMCDLAYKNHNDAICITEEIYHNSNIQANSDGETFQDFFRNKKKYYNESPYYNATFYRANFGEYTK